MSGSDYSYQSENSTGYTARVGRKPVLHPVLDQASMYSGDPYWKSKLEDAARGKLPKGFSIRNGSLIFRKKDSTKSKVIPVNPENAASMFIVFLKEHGNMLSDKDANYSAMNATANMEINQAQEITWVSIPILTKEMMIDSYVAKCGEYWDLTKEQTGNLRRTILTGLTLGLFNKDDGKITLSQDISQILHIDCIQYLDGRFVINSDVWDKLTLTLEKKVNNIQINSYNIPHSMYGRSNSAIAKSHNKLMKQTGLHYGTLCLKSDHFKNMSESQPVIIVIAD